MDELEKLGEVSKKLEEIVEQLDDVKRIVTMMERENVVKCVVHIEELVAAIIPLVDNLYTQLYHPGHHGPRE